MTNYCFLLITQTAFLTTFSSRSAVAQFLWANVKSIDRNTLEIIEIWTSYFIEWRVAIYHLENVTVTVQHFIEQFVGVYDLDSYLWYQDIKALGLKPINLPNQSP
ncbi:hypothetical protein RhiirA5_414961 [Rhizophagus irregularis]|uniref:Uncharacterized protein n=1 Tax=Rhizophagus irregularis TaxID=588596 RepID=A0A2N0S497_9GLOM|nr:hypothetical protein RhiirA5_414961 [Rhizophagus irregularis]PKC70385.1 hypothetical protein RhiirA1_454830 [Rhizophagus irregularis]